ncbi:MAG TPA: hypothetical protein VLB76_21710 [Thermoanaerobaculia bacterium]|jgi:hypothetical protein|nr:hypothetical protein [Thermoanaerobaculia bacterium]
MRSHSKPLLVVLALSSLVLGAAPPQADPKAEISDMDRQRLTMADIRNVGTAMFSWLTDQVGASAAGAQETEKATEKPVRLAPYRVISTKELKKLLVPQYLERIPETDGWGHPYEFRLNVKDVLGRNVMMIRSPGRDGTYSAKKYSTHGFDPEDYDEDIVWADGFFVRWPQRGDR